MEEKKLTTNAGAPVAGMFDKRIYKPNSLGKPDLPYGLSLELDTSKWSHIYYCWVRKTEKNSALWKQEK